MTREELAQMIESIRTTEDAVTRNNFLLKLDADYNQMLASHAELSTEIEALNTQNTEYAKQNNALWLKLNANVIPNEQTPIAEDHEPKLSYDDLEF